MSNFSDRDGWIWMDGEFVPWREARVHVLTHTLHYGMGVFEGVRAYATDRGAAIFRLEDHTRRLFGSEMPGGYAVDQPENSRRYAFDSGLSIGAGVFFGGTCYLRFATGQGRCALSP